ncbi:single-stranded DNA-binding protein [Candidatus Calescamantes bacterium]|nr:single-stranded DNA-binding protein [Candidatus Calescamantes bacterium]
MAFYLNRVMLGGNITADPEVREVTNNRVCNFTLAVNRTNYSHTGDTTVKKEDTVFVRVTAWNKLADQLSNYIKKGANLFVEGRLTSRQWATDEGKTINYLDVTAEKITFVTSKGRDGNSQEPAGKTEEDNHSAPAATNDYENEIVNKEGEEDTSDLWSND